MTTINTIAILGLGEAGSTLADGLCSSNGWRAAQPNRRIIAIDPAIDSDARGKAMADQATRLGIAAEREYGPALNEVDLVISVVTGVEATNAAKSALPHLPPSAVYADFNSITGPQTREVAAALEPAGITFADVAVMGSFMANGIDNPLLLSGPGADRFYGFTQHAGIPARILNDNTGDASAVKILRTILMKGVEGLLVECLVTARRQGLVDEVLDNISDVDKIGFAEFAKVLTISHLPHAKRRMEEVEKAIENLNETGVPVLMSEATRQSHARTVAAQLDAAEVMNIDLDEALRLLDERVVPRTKN